MKKLAIVLLAIVFVATLSLASFAATVPSSEGKDLAVGYTEMTAAGTVYSVTVAWDDDLAFDYTAGTQGAWNPEDHSYGETTGAQWTDNDVNVTVTNHSNAKVTATLTLSDKADGFTFTGEGSETLASAVNTAVAEAPAVTFTVTVSGTPTAAVAKVATATVSLAAAQ